MSKRNAKGKAGEQTVRLLPPGSNEARDEGPRLIPFGRLPEESRVQRYLELADAALNCENKKKKAEKSKKQARPARRP